MQSRAIKVAAPPLESPHDRLVTYPAVSKTSVKSSKGRNVLTLNMTLKRVENFKYEYLGVILQEDKSRQTYRKE
jgi:hypothetical protein